MISPSEVTTFASDLGVPVAGLQKISELRLASGDYGVWQSVAVLILTLLFPNKTFLPNTTGYNASMNINWSTRAWLPPQVIFTPTSAEDVAKSVKIINYFSVPFAVRSGGHTPFPGSASISGGILVSLQNMTSLELSESKDLVSVGPGNRWINVYNFLEPYNIAVVGGRVPSIGVGGLTTGGGNSYFSTSHGMACDNVASFEVVIADGRIVTASPAENKDLFWALKGGSNNFGIVTRFDLFAIPIPNGKVWGGNLVFLPQQFNNVTDAIAEYQMNGQVTDPGAAIIPNLFYMGVGNVNIFTVTVFHASGQKPASLDPIFKVGPVSDTSSQRTLAEMAEEAGGGDAAIRVVHLRTDFRTLSIGVSSEFYHEIVALFQQTFTTNTNITSIAGYLMTLTFQPIAASTVAQGKARGGNAMGVSEKAQMWLCLTSFWALPSDDQVMLPLTISFLKQVEDLARAKGLFEPYLFLNDAAIDQKVIASYGDAQVEGLAEVSKKYDPKGVFQKLAKGGFKLPEIS
ncbi:FAD-binding domain-containing protein [Choiromyces venosus 120613-1]|uniref:FAD-binding domain-containing protein n=1 Tax=Choiromyces venosus 120613-1 TaxID=1336337 RepID=A0A3N4JEF1_9PEZI|nr:FAD-binding domain-containing protein [Choiromyces venosus 120613-1]